jgi:hypothetical protein
MSIHVQRWTALVLVLAVNAPATAAYGQAPAPEATAVPAGRTYLASAEGAARWRITVTRKGRTVTITTGGVR